MKISELIKQLELVMRSEGDLDCVVFDDGDYMRPDGYLHLDCVEVIKAEQAYKHESNEFTSEEFQTLGTHQEAIESPYIQVKTQKTPETVKLLCLGN